MKNTTQTDSALSTPGQARVTPGQARVDELMHEQRKARIAATSEAQDSQQNPQARLSTRHRNPRFDELTARVALLRQQSATSAGGT